MFYPPVFNWLHETRVIGASPDGIIKNIVSKSNVNLNIAICVNKEVPSS